MANNSCVRYFVWKHSYFQYGRGQIFVCIKHFVWKKSNFKYGCGQEFICERQMLPTIHMCKYVVLEFICLRHGGEIMCLKVFQVLINKNIPQSPRIHTFTATLKYQTQKWGNCEGIVQSTNGLWKSNCHKPPISAQGDFRIGLRPSMPTKHWSL